MIDAAKSVVSGRQSPQYTQTALVFSGVKPIHAKSDIPKQEAPNSGP